LLLTQELTNNFLYQFRTHQVKNIKSLLLSTCLLLGIATPAQATLLAYAIDTVSDQLLQIDLTTGTTTVIGDTGFADIEGLSFQRSTGILFGLDDASDQLITLNLNTGVGTVVGSLGFNFSDAGLAFDENGNLYASGDLGNSGLYSVNFLTGAASFISNSGDDSFDIAFFNGALYGVSDDCDSDDCLQTVNTLTGDTTFVGSLGGINVDEGGLDFDNQGNLWFVEKNENTIFQINILTGLATAGANIDCRPNNCQLEGLAIIDTTRTVTVPEPSTIAIFSLALLGFSFLQRRKSS